MPEFTPRHGWGPNRKRAALSITFDNLGEAAWLEMNMWGDRPVGEHYTAPFVPRLIETLGDVRATFFVEASNAAIYPKASGSGPPPAMADHAVRRPAAPDRYRVSGPTSGLSASTRGVVVRHAEVSGEAPDGYRRARQAGKRRVSR